MIAYSPKDYTRLWKHVRRGGIDSCWPYTRSLSPTGYGQLMVKYRNRPGFHVVKTHRLAYEAVHGPFDTTLHVLHSCDNPKCCNPMHLSLGTHAENMAQRQMRGRSRGARGTRNASHRYTPRQVLAVRRAWASGEYRFKVEVARKYGVEPCDVSRMTLGKTWSHLAP